MTFIFIDPSGSFDEGKGHTGVAVMNDMDWNSLQIYSAISSKFKSRFEYWKSIITFAKSYEDAIIIIESFTIRNNGFLMGKMPETIRFIGALQYALDESGIPYIFQTPSQAKSRFKDIDLTKHIPNFEYRTNGRYYFKGKIINDHSRDALKHLLYFHKYNKGKVMKDE